MEGEMVDMEEEEEWVGGGDWWMLATGSRIKVSDPSTKVLDQTPFSPDLAAPSLSCIDLANSCCLTLKLLLKVE